MRTTSFCTCASKPLSAFDSFAFDFFLPPNLKLGRNERPLPPVSNERLRDASESTDCTTGRSGLRSHASDASAVRSIIVFVWSAGSAAAAAIARSRAM